MADLTITGTAMTEPLLEFQEQRVDDKSVPLEGEALLAHQLRWKGIREFRGQKEAYPAYDDPAFDEKARRWYQSKDKQVLEQSAKEKDELDKWTAKFDDSLESTVPNDKGLLWYRSKWNLIIEKARNDEMKSAKEIDEILQQVTARSRERFGHGPMRFDEQAVWEDRELYSRLYPGNDCDISLIILTKPKDLLAPQEKKKNKKQRAIHAQRVIPLPQVDEFRAPEGFEVLLPIVPALPYAALPTRISNQYAASNYVSTNTPRIVKNDEVKNTLDILSKLDPLGEKEQSQDIAGELTLQVLPDIRELCKDMHGHQMVLLNTMKPHSGILLDVATKKKRKYRPVGSEGTMLLESQGRDTNTSGIDVFLVTLRVLLSCGMVVIPKTPAELTLVKYAWMNWGWNKERDWEMKYALMKEAFGTDLVASTNFQTFESYLKRGGIKGLIGYSKEFRLVCTHSARHTTNKVSNQRGQPATTWKWSVTSMEDSRDMNRRQLWDGMATLQEHMDKMFTAVNKGEFTFHPFASAPNFVRLSYQNPNNNSSYEISDMRTFNLKAKTAWKNVEAQWFQGVQNSTFLLIAVVRLARKSKETTNKLLDDVRVYWENGEEIAPPELACQTSTLMDKAQRIDKKSWSVKEEGNYMLFYKRVENISQADLQTIKNAPEFAQRQWPQSKMRPSKAEKRAKRLADEEKLQGQVEDAEQKQQTQEDIEFFESVPRESKAEASSRKRQFDELELQDEVGDSIQQQSLKESGSPCQKKARLDEGQ